MHRGRGCASTKTHAHENAYKNTRFREKTYKNTRLQTRLHTCLLEQDEGLCLPHARVKKGYKRTRVHRRTPAQTRDCWSKTRACSCLACACFRRASIAHGAAAGLPKLASSARRSSVMLASTEEALEPSRRCLCSRSKRACSSSSSAPPRSAISQRPLIDPLRGAIL